MMVHSQHVSRDTPSNVRDILLSENRFATWFAETIRASGRVRCANRPDTSAAAIHTGHSCIAQPSIMLDAAVRTEPTLATWDSKKGAAQKGRMYGDSAILNSIVPIAETDNTILWISRSSERAPLKLS